MRAGFAKLRQQLWPSTPSFLVVFVGVCFGFHSNVEMTSIGSGVTLGIFTIWFMAWLVRLLEWHRRAGASDDKNDRGMLCWIIEPATALLLLVLVNLHVFTWLRFLMSVYFMQSYAETQIMAESKKRIVGLYLVHSYESYKTENGPTQIRMRTLNSSMSGSAGFVYMSSGSEPERVYTEAIYFTHLYGPWWMWRLDHRSTMP